MQRVDVAQCVWAVVQACAGSSGCTFTHPLAVPPAIPMRKQPAGLRRRPDDELRCKGECTAAAAASVAAGVPSGGSLRPPEAAVAAGMVASRVYS